MKRQSGLNNVLILAPWCIVMTFQLENQIAVITIPFVYFLLFGVFWSNKCPSNYDMFHTDWIRWTQKCFLILVMWFVVLLRRLYLESIVHSVISFDFHRKVRICKNCNLSLNLIKCHKTLAVNAQSWVKPFNGMSYYRLVILTS